MDRYTVVILVMAWASKKELICKIMLKSQINGLFQVLEEYNRLLVKIKRIYIVKTKTLYPLHLADSKILMKARVACKKIMKTLSN